MSTAAADRPAWFLFGSEGQVGDRFNESTATGLTSKGVSITASFFPNHPPQPSKLCVSCPGALDVDNPRVLCIAGNLILFRVAIAIPGGLPIDRPSSVLRCDYFIYRAEPNRSMLKLLPNLPSGSSFRDFEVGVLPREDDGYTIAALVPVPSSRDRFELLLFQSSTWTWTSVVLPVVPPHREFPTNAAYFFRHYTTSVITLGGEYGTIGWVDLWRGILLCDVLRENLTLRYVPLPLPMKQITSNKVLGLDLGRARNSRGIAFVDGFLKLVELDLSATEFTQMVDEETGYPTMQVDDWTVTTWTKKTMTDSYDDWHNDDWELQGSKITVNKEMVSHSTGLLQLPSQVDEDGNKSTVIAERALQKLVVSDPSVSLDGDDVVYLMARLKVLHHKPWILALDMRNKKLQSVVPFGIVEQPAANVMYCTSSH